MAGLSFGAILPHGAMIPAIAGADRVKMAAINGYCEEAGRLCKASAPQTIVVITPHGVMASNAFTVGLTERAEGRLDEGEGFIERKFKTDLPLAQEMLALLQKEEVSAVGLVGGEAEDSVLPLDWGALIPLWHCTSEEAALPEVVVATPCRSLTLEQHRAFGRGVVKAAENMGRSIAFIASCDWAHAHREDGPYGYHPDAAKLDALVQEAVAADALSSLEGLDAKLIENAKIDGLWPATMLSGALQYADADTSAFQCRYLGYSCPTYFGMLAAVWVP